MSWILIRPWRAIFGGLLVIAAGLIRGESVFFGDFSLRPLIFDAIGLFFIGLGGLRLIRAKFGAAVPPSASPPAT